MKCVLNDKKISSLKAERKRLEVRDTLMPGFGIRITPNGQKTFFVTCRSRGKLKRITIGHYPIITLSEAREIARNKLRLALDGKLEETDGSASITVQKAFDLFIEIYAKKNNKDWQKVQSRMSNGFIKDYGALNLTDLKRKDILCVLDKMIARNTPIQANRTHSSISKFLKWCVERGYIENNPAACISKPAKENPRDRVLTEDELTAIWRRSEGMGYPFGPIIQLLILTGQRRGEVAGMRWSEINFKENVWVIPKERSKNGKAHSVPLTHTTRSILEALPRFLHSDFVFTTTGITPVSGLGKIKDRIAKSINQTDWTIHDLRRTAASGMARLKVPPHVVEKILNHTSGTFSSVAGVYNRHGYDDEKRDALKIWEHYLIGICLPHGRSSSQRNL